MEGKEHCPECGALWRDGETCQGNFQEMLVWEAENPATIAQVHHLMVLSFHLQHPTLYSPEGLAGAKNLLVDFLVRGLATAQVRKRNRSRLDSGNRTWKITGIPGSVGSYDHPVRWTMTAADVIAGGALNYCDNVEAWAQSIYASLKASGNLPAEKQTNR